VTVGIGAVISVAILLAGGGRLDAKSRAAAIEYAKRLPAESIEAGLPTTSLDEWLRRTVNAGSLQWFISDCDLITAGEAPKRVPLCIGARVSDRDPIYLRFHLAVGNMADGVSGKPCVLKQSFVSCNRAGQPSDDSLRSFGQLSALPAIVDRLKTTCGRVR
jgi:hypothetical protein